MQAICNLKAAADRFAVTLSQEAAQWLKDAESIIDECSIVLCTGLLFQAFKSSADKVALRDAVVKALKVLAARKLDTTRLVPALRTRVEQAKAFKVLM